MLTKLERMHVYVANFDEKFEIMENKKRHEFIKTVESVQKLVSSLATLNERADPVRLNKRNITKIRFKTQRDSNMFTAWSNGIKSEQSVVKFKRRAHDRIGKIRALANIEPMFDSNDLIVIKSHINCLLDVIDSYYMLRKKYFNTNEMFNSSKTNVKFYRYILWVPEFGTRRNEDLSSALTMLNSVNKRSAFKIFILNWHLDVDWTLNKLVDQIIANRSDFDNAFKSAGKYTLKLLSRDYFLNDTDNRWTSKSGSITIEKVQFKINDDNLQLNNDLLPLLFSSNSFYSGRKAAAAALGLTKHRPTYRIVSTQVEPFVIVSQLDEHLVSKDECKDGLPCLDIESDIYNDNQYFFKDKKKHHLHGKKNMMLRLYFDKNKKDFEKYSKFGLKIT
jgi:hypothetical protein